MNLAHGHLDKQIEGEGELTEAERERAILDATSLKFKITFVKKELSLLNKKQKTKLSQWNTAARVEVTRVEREIGKYSKPFWQGLECILWQGIGTFSGQVGTVETYSEMPDVNGLF
jgi:hypothetical protein